MGVGDQILFFVAGLGAFNGLLLALYFFFIVKPQRWINILFGLLMLTLCIRVGKSLFHSFTDLERIYRQVGLSVCILIGPLLYLYIRSAILQKPRPSVNDWKHLLLPAIAIITVGIIWPYETQPALWNNTFVKGIYAVWLAYVIASTTLIAPLAKKLSSKQASIYDSWILLVYGCVSLLCVAYIMAYYGFPYLAGPILFSVVFYVLIGFLVSKEKRSVILHKEANKYQNQRISLEKGDELLQRLSVAMEQQQYYLDAKIKLAEVADAVHASSHEVSQVINDRLGMSFNYYINSYRIKAACKMLKENDHLTVEGIGHEVGFNSRSAFYVAFKTFMKQSPAQYKSQLKASQP